MIRIGEAYFAESEIAAIHPDSAYDSRIWVTLKGGRNVYVNVEMLEAARALSDAGLLHLADIEPGDLALIVLENLADAGLRYIARDENGALFAYEEKPKRGTACWSAEGQSAPVPEPVFRQHIQWTDAEPGDVRMMLDEARLDRWQFA